MSDMIELAHVQFNAIASRTITFAKDDKPVYIIEADSDRCSDAFLPINSINHNSEFYDVIANFVKKYNGNAEVPFNYVSRFYLKDMSSGKVYAFILNDTAYYAKNRIYTSMDYIKAYLGDDPEKWDEFAKMIKTETMPFEGIVYSVSRDGDHVVREKNDWKRDRHLLFAPYGEIEFRPNKFKHLLTNSLEGVEVKDQNDA
nr:MAG TPA: hypothetical protein [Caudoviricetes sp.]